MNEFDQFVKHVLKIKYYARYTDDFVILSESRKYLEYLLPKIEIFLNQSLKLKLHPEKVSLQSYVRGSDFLGYVSLSHHVVPRTKTRKRMMRKLRERVESYKAGAIEEEQLFASLRSYLGILSHANAHDLREEVLNQFWFWLKG